VTRDRASVEPSTDHSLSHSHPLPVPFIPRCSPRLFLYSSEFAGRWELPGVVRSPKVLSVADLVAVRVVDISQSESEAWRRRER
jgi:hypothetical protein